MQEQAKLIPALLGRNALTLRQDIIKASATLPQAYPLRILDQGQPSA